MVVKPSHLSWLSWRGKWQRSKVDNSSSSDTAREPGSNVNGRNITSTYRRVERKWRGHEGLKFDMENDVVLVSHDGGCVSGSDSDDCEWSVGWLEPHGPEFLSYDNDESNNSFAVLVPCYGREVHNPADIPQIKFFDPAGNFSDSLPAESKKYMEQWLSSLHTN